MIIAAIIIALILIVICIYAIKSYTKKLCFSCREAGGSEEKKVQVQDKNPSHYSYNAIIHIEGMTCYNCKVRVENAFNSKDGVWAQADLKNNSAFVRMKKSLSPEDIRQIVSQAGYTATGMQMIL